MRAGRLSIGLIVVALAGVAVGPADADITIDVPGVTETTITTPSVEVPGPPGHGPLKVQPPNVQVTVPRGAGRPTITVDPGTPVATPPTTPPPTPPAPTPPVGTPPTSDPTADPTPSTRSSDAAGADAQTTTSAPTTSAPSSHTPAATSTPAAKSHTVAPITRSGHSASRGRVAKRAAPRAAPKPTFPAAPTTTTPTTKRARHPKAAPKERVEKSDAPRSIGTAIGDVVDVVDRLPGWVLGIFVGFAALAVAMAINAYVSSRRARRLAAQRAELVDDVGHLQAALLGSVPATPGDVAFSVAYRPAAGLAAGGDFYDVFALDDHRTAIVLGDVSGHGRESVAHAALVRYTLRTFLAAGHGPAEAIALTDPCLDGHLDDQFATVVAAIYDEAVHAIAYATAGHYPPLLLGVDDEAPSVAAAPPIGAGLRATPTDTTLALPPDATVCFFTDGLVEARRAGSPLGTERVAQLLADAPDDAEALIAAVAAEADDLNDDLAVCLLHRVADAVEPAFELSGPRSAQAVAA